MVWSTAQHRKDIPSIWKGSASGRHWPLQWEGRRRHSPCDSLLLSIRSQDPRAELQGFVFSALSQACLLQLLEYQ